MNDYERMLSQVQMEVPVIETSLAQFESEGFYRNGKIFIERSLSVKRKKEILAEEYAHYKTTVGNIIDLNDAGCRKQEVKARNVSFEMLISLDDLILCSKQGFTTAYACAEYLDVSEETLNEALKYYLTRFGTTHFYKNNLINFFDHGLMVLDTGLA